MPTSTAKLDFGAHLFKDVVAEFLGTFALIFIGAGAVITLGPTNFAAVALAHGFVIMGFAYAFGNESNSYLNPALTVGIIVANPGTFRPAISIFIAQILGGISGGLLLVAIYGSNAPHALGMTTIDETITSISGGLLLEATGAFLLMTIVLNAATRGSAGKFAPFAIGMTVAFCIMSFGPVTGASMNPARTLGPAVALGNYSQVVLYMVAQFSGAIFAAVLYRVLFSKPLGNEVGYSDEEQPAF